MNPVNAAAMYLISAGPYETKGILWHPGKKSIRIFGKVHEGSCAAIEQRSRAKKKG